MQDKKSLDISQPLGMTVYDLPLPTAVVQVMLYFWYQWIKPYRHAR